MTAPARFNDAEPYDADFAPAAALIADPTRAAILRALLPDRPLAAGELAPGEAIAAGRVRVRGDLSVLAEAQAVLGAVAPHLQELRDRTGY